mgnify:CR=1 FL=1
MKLAVWQGTAPAGDAAAGLAALAPALKAAGAMGAAVLVAPATPAISADDELLDAAAIAPNDGEALVPLVATPAGILFRLSGGDHRAISR